MLDSAFCIKRLGLSTHPTPRHTLDLVGTEPRMQTAKPLALKIDTGIEQVEDD